MSLYAEIAFNLPINQLFTYSIPFKLIKTAKIGSRVIAPFGRRKLIGYIIHLLEKSPYESPKEVIEILDHETSVSRPILNLCKWISSYYFCSLGEAIGTSQPLWIDKKFITDVIVTEKGRKYLSTIDIDSTEKELLLYISGFDFIDLSKIKRKFKNINCSAIINSFKKKKYIELKKNIKSKNSRKKDIEHTPNSLSINKIIKLTEKQKEAINNISSSICSNKKDSFLLQGVTGSGKTEVYLHCAEKAIKKKKEVIVLVPEISLTAQVVEKFTAKFGDKIALLHSGLTPSEKINEWMRIIRGKAVIAIGARSAIFAPFNDLGLIIVDEEHDQSYKQGDSLRYNARDLAVLRGYKEKAVTILGSATPSFESYHNCKEGKYKYLSLPKRIDGSSLPEKIIVDLRHEQHDTIVSKTLIAAIREKLKNKEQVLLFLNRRVSSTFIQCLDCGNVWKCNNCDISLTYHDSDKIIRCHYCGFFDKTPEICPVCNGINISFKGSGTQKLEKEVKAIFPEAKVNRLDRDSSRRKGELNRIFKDIKSGELDILIGTQMISKGHDYPNITLAGIVNADTLLNIPDFRSGERSFQQITQVAGRAGRGSKKGKVVLQTYTPDNDSINCALDNMLESFYTKELQYRKELEYPPYSRMISFMVVGTNETKVNRGINGLSNISNTIIAASSNIKKLGPVKAITYRLKNNYRWQLLLKGSNITALHVIAKKIINTWNTSKNSYSGCRLIIDVDPMEIL